MVAITSSLGRYAVLLSILVYGSSLTTAFADGSSASVGGGAHRMLQELQVSFSGRGAPPTPLPECHGDCDNDNHCEGDLLCYQRTGTQPVPGCSGDTAAAPKTDYCARRPTENTLWMRGNNGRPKAYFPLGLCEGDCDSDAECQPGLVCQQRKNEPVPGCIGEPEFRKDYCVVGSTPQPTATVTAAPTPGVTSPFTLQVSFSGSGVPPNPLPQCHGDCDDDTQCEGDLQCFQRFGTEVVPGCFGNVTASPTTDYCAHRPTVDTLWMKGDNGSPAANFPLGLCEGDCDSDAQCQPGLVCQYRSGNEPIPGCVGEPVPGEDYCRYPDPTAEPTPQPTPQPTTAAPTSEPTPTPKPTTAAPTPEPTSPFTLQVSFSGSGVPPNPLPQCHGDCDDDTQCEGDLQCFQRFGTEVVPGCFGNVTASPTTDYCAHRPTVDTLWMKGDNGSPAANFPLGLCEGDCDSDAQCQPGLVCQYRSGNEPIPGCVGEPVPGEDYCRYPDPTAEPTPQPTPQPTTAAPTSEPTPNPTLAPSNPPTNVPTPQPTNEPTSEPTPAPSAPPTSLPTSEPTSPPTNVPTSNPTAPPTGNPTSPPTFPTNDNDIVYCPSEAEEIKSVKLTSTSGMKTLARSTATSFCGIFIELESGDLIPYARSYSANDWEPSPGPKAAPFSGIECGDLACTVDLPPPSSGSYIIMTKPTSALEDKDKIARFLEMTSFGPMFSEIESLNVGSFGETERAAAVRQQMDLPKSSHREYFRHNANPKWDATTQNARSDHPCDPYSRWRDYAYIKHDREDTITGEDLYTTFEQAPEDSDSTFTIYQADSQDDVTFNTGTLRSAADGNAGFSGDGYYDMSGYDDYVQFTISVAEDVDVPISFRYAQGSSSYNGNRPCVLSVNGNTVRDVYDFSYSDSYSYWIYSEMVTVSLSAGFNTIKLLVRDQNGGPNIDFLRVGSPPALLMKTNGWLRHVAKNGVGVVNEWGFDFTDQTVYFTQYQNVIEGDLYRYPYGRLEVNVTGQEKYLDIGNPKLDFDGYESHLPLSHFILNNGEVFEDTSSDLYDYPIVKGQEFVLPSGLDRSLYPICDTIASSEEYSSPVFAKTPEGKWLQWSPIIKLESNGPSMNASPGDKASYTLIDGGGEGFLQTGEKLKCANVARSFENEDTCIYSTSSTACSPTRELGEVIIDLNETSITAFYEFGDKYVYAISGLAMENLDQHACVDTQSRWEVEQNTICSSPTPLEAATIAALGDAFASSLDQNALLKDVTLSLSCDPLDVHVDKLDMQIQVDADCYTHVHRDHKNVYDFSGWVSNHPGGEYNIQKWAEGFNDTDGPVPGWYLDYPYPGVPERKVPQHPMSRWDNNKGEPYIVFVGKLGNSIAYRDLPSNLKTNSIADHFGATAIQNEAAGTIVCGSHGEVANDRTRREQFEVRSNEEQVTSSDVMDNQRHVVWYELGLWAQDQLRQRMAFALSELLTIVPQNIDADTYTEVYTKYYDIFVNNAFGNYADIMKLVSYSPLMSEHLTYLKSKSHPYIFRKEDKRVSSPDENYAREIMQLFTIGLFVLNEDGTQVIDSSTGKPKETYTNEDIESFARAWTGFDRQAVRGNYEERRGGSTDNKIDPLQVIAAYRDPFPKADLAGGFLGDRYLRCVDLPSQSFLKKGAVYTLRGASPLSEYRTDPSQYATETDSAEKFALDTNSALYQRLHNGGQYKLSVELDEDLVCTATECNVDTVRMVKVDDVYYEFKERPCVQMAFYDDGKQIRAKENKDLGSMCANPNLAHASEACCREERYQEVRQATKVTGVTYFYEGERTKYNTARDRCVNAGKDLCMFEYTNVSPVNDWWKKGYSWTNKDCEIMVKVNSEGYIAVVHDADNSYKNQIDRYGIPAEVDEYETLNWFKVHWDGDFPGSSPANSCAANKCKAHSDGSCVCKTSVSESAVFDSIVNVDKEQVMGQLFIGAMGPEATSVSNRGTGFTAHVVNGLIDTSTVFEVEDKGRTFFLKNIVSEVHLNGWEAVPTILEAEDAVVLQNATIKDSAELSASNGFYIDFDATDEAYVTWDVSVSYTGDYSMSLRYALDTYTRQMEVYVNDEEIKWTSSNANPIIDLDYISSNPQGADGFEPMSRCQGDCDIDDHCAAGLFCFQVNKGGSAFPGCNGASSADFCVDPNDVDNMLFLPTGGPNDDWRLTEGKIVPLVEGVNTIKVKCPFGNDKRPTIDYLKIEGLPSPTIASKFRNPPHFVAVIGEENSYTEQNMIDAQYETDALLEHLVYHDNVAPFLTTRIMQRFGVSNPSPRYVKTCVEAFKTGFYTSGGTSFGDSSYGSLEALSACIVLDREATDEALYEDPAFGSLREPIIMVMNLLRSMEYSNTLPTVGLDGPPLAEFYNVRLYKMNEKIGQSPHDFPSVFSFFLPEYVPEAGPALSAQLAAPEATILDMPKIIGMQNGMTSLIKYGLSDCNDGYGRYPGYKWCSDDGLYYRSIGHLDRVPAGTTIAELVSEVSLLLTAGRLSQDNRDTIEAACSAETDHDAQFRCIQQLIVFSTEFHSTNKMEKSGEDRAVDTTTVVTSTEPYKGLVYLYISGGLDSFHLLAPHTCAPINVYERFRAIRGKNSLSEGIGMKLDEMLVIDGNNPDQPCSTFGIHPNLPILHALYNDGDAAFIANAGLMAEPVDVNNYRQMTPVQLFAHNDMNRNTQKEDIFDEFVGTGVQGRIADVLKGKDMPVNVFSISGTQPVNVGEPGGAAPFILSSSGLSDFNKSPSISDMNTVIRSLNNATRKDSGFFAETFANKLSEAITSHEQLKAELDAVDVSTVFPDSGIAAQLKVVAQLMKTRESRGVVRDMFYVEHGGYDTHSNMQINLVNKFTDLNAALEAFVAEVKQQGLWDSVTLVQFSEFARTLDPNTGDGSDHAWGANHFHIGGGLNGGKVRGLYPDDFVQSPSNPIALSRGRMVPTYSWDAMWKGTAEWFGIDDGSEMDKVLPMHSNFPGKIYNAAELYV